MVELQDLGTPVNPVRVAVTHANLYPVGTRWIPWGIKAVRIGSDPEGHWSPLWAEPDPVGRDLVSGIVPSNRTSQETMPGPEGNMSPWSLWLKNTAKPYQHTNDKCATAITRQKRLAYSTTPNPCGYPESRLEGEDWIGHYELVPLED